MLSSALPYPPTRGGIQVRTFNLLQYLSQNHEITLVTQRPEDATDEQIEYLNGLVEQLVMFPQVTAKEGLLERAKRWGNFVQQGTPPFILENYSPEMQEWIDQAVPAGEFEVITCEHSFNEVYINPDWHEQVRIVVNIHSSISRIHQDQLATHSSDNELRDQINLPLLRRYEQRYCEKFSALVVTTSADRKHISNLEPEANIVVIPNGVDLSLFPRRASNPGGQRLLFVGAMDNDGDIDAVRFFVLEVLPAIQARYPETTLELVGSRPAPEIQELAQKPGITMTGHVSSVVEYLHWATICVVPMRIGLGIKNKALEAMAAGVPVVGSDRGLEGLEVDGADIPLRAMRANSVDEYVYAIGRLFDEPKLREKLSENARAMIEKEYSWERAGSQYEQVLVGDQPSNPTISFES